MRDEYDSKTYCFTRVHFGAQLHPDLWFCWGRFSLGSLAAPFSFYSGGAHATKKKLKSPSKAEKPTSVRKEGGLCGQDTGC